MTATVFLSKRGSIERRARGEIRAKHSAYRALLTVAWETDDDWTREQAARMAERCYWSVETAVYVLTGKPRGSRAVPTPPPRADRM